MEGFWWFLLGLAVGLFTGWSIGREQVLEEWWEWWFRIGRWGGWDWRWDNEVLQLMDDLHGQHTTRR